MCYMNSYKNSIFLTKFRLENIGSFLRICSKVYKIVKSRPNSIDNYLYYRELKNQG